MPAESPAVIIFDQDGNPVDVIHVDGYYRIAVDSKAIIDSDPFTIDRDKIVVANMAKQGITTTTYYMFIDLDGADYKHTPGSYVVAAGISGAAFKSNSGASWEVDLMVILDIDGVSADLGFVPGGSILLRDTSKFSDEKIIELFPTVVSLEVSGGDFTKITTGLIESGVTDINTGVLLEDIVGNNVTPAVGDVLLRVTNTLGAGTLQFAYGMQYWVE
jgi:hypothetical protein